MDPKQAEIDKAFYHDPSGTHTIHTARKAGRCQFGRRHDGATPCCNEIKPGDRYVAGAYDYHAGPWSRERWCMECVQDAITWSGP